MPASHDQHDHEHLSVQDSKPDAGAAEPGRPGPFHPDDLLVLLRPETSEEMFHTEIVAGTGKVVDFERASRLMDQELLASAKKGDAGRADTQAALGCAVRHGMGLGVLLRAAPREI